MNLQVPRHVQDDGDNCGPAVAQMAASFLSGAVADQTAIATRILAHPQPSSTWVTTPEALKTVVNEELTAAGLAAAYDVKNFGTKDQLKSGISESLLLGHPALVPIGGLLGHWVVVVGLRPPTKLTNVEEPYDHLANCVDPMPSADQLYSPFGFVTEHCITGSTPQHASLCADLAASPVGGSKDAMGVRTPHSPNDGCDIVDGADAFPTVAAWQTRTEYNVVVDLGVENPLDDIVGVNADGAVVRAPTTPPHDGPPPRPLPLEDFLRSLRRWWRRTERRIRRPPRADPPAILAALSLLPAALVPKVRSNEQWQIRRLGLPSASTLRVFAVLDRRADTGWFVLVDEDSGRFVMARRAVRPLLESFRKYRGRELWWKACRQSSLPIYPFVPEPSGALRRITDGRVYARKDLV
jgi:hypothetical protein